MNNRLFDNYGRIIAIDEKGHKVEKEPPKYVNYELITQMKRLGLIRNVSQYVINWN